MFIFLVTPEEGRQKRSNGLSYDGERYRVHIIEKNIMEVSGDVMFS